MMFANKLLKWMIFIALAAIVYFSVAVASNANRRERLCQFLSGEPMLWEDANDSTGR